MSTCGKCPQCVPEVNVRYVAAELRKLGDNELALECLGHQLCALAQHPEEIKALVERIKGIDRPFRGGVESIFIRSLLVNWRLGKFFISYFKEPSSQDQQKTLRRRLITFKVTLTGQSHSVKSLYAVTSTPYHECTRSHQLRTMNVRSLAR
jgi:hypothetical protein